jgi:hypothetical protein
MSEERKVTPPMNIPTRPQQMRVMSHFNVVDPMHIAGYACDPAYNTCLAKLNIPPEELQKLEEMMKDLDEKVLGKRFH